MTDANASERYRELMQEAREYADDGQHGRARSARLSAARLLGRHTKEEWQAMLEYIDGVCPRCGIPAQRFDKDHIIPIYAGGSDGIDNIQPLCAPCNSQKGPERINWLLEDGR